jgi:CYTH domain-containing protein
MKAVLQSSNFVHQHDFTVEYDGVTFNVSIFLNQKEKFIDNSIKLNDNELEFEGEQGQIREDILNYLSDNWDKIV